MTTIIAARLRPGSSVPAALALSLLASASGAAAQSPTADGQVWLNAVVTGRIAPRVIASADTQVRLGDNASRATQSVARGWIGYQVRRVTIGAGFARVDLYPANRPISREDRPFQQVSWSAGLGKIGALSARARLEERWLSSGREVGLRYRQLVRFDERVGVGHSSLIWQAETLVNLNSTDWGVRPGFDQLRGLAGISFPVGSRISVEAGYQVQRVFGARPQVNHTIPLTILFDSSRDS